MLRDLVLLATVVAGLMAGSQVPSFVDAYAQRLGGALDEARRQVDGFRAAAVGQGLSLEEFLTRHRESSDPVFQATGREIERALDRATSLAERRAALSSAGPWRRPLVLIRDPDTEILANTYADWRPGLSVDPRWGGIGFAVGWIVHFVTAVLLRRLVPGRRTRQT